MDRTRWTEVDRYVTEHLLGPDPALDAALEANASGGLPAIDVSPPQGKFLNLLARIHGARTILEIGTLGGYSTIWLARALPQGGRLVTLELDPHHAEVAQRNVERAGLGELVDFRVGPALQTLDDVAREGLGPFDLTFIDADKVNTPEYVKRAIELSRPGSVIIADNVVRDGRLVDPAAAEDPSTQGNRRLHEFLAAEPRVDATTIQTVGSKGYDGFTLALVERV